MNYEVLSLVPAAITILVALITHRVALALFLGVLGGAFVLSGYQLMPFLEDSSDYLLTAFTDTERLKIVLFVMLIGGMLEVIAGSGAYNKFASVLSGKLNTPRRARVGTWAVSMCLFFDDYANVLISGASMRKINLRNRVTPAQLAYIVDVVAIMASVMIVSTWASFEGSVMAEAGKTIGMNKSITIFFLESLPYHFYTFLAIIMAFVVAYSGKWFGYRADNATYQLNSKSDVNNNRSKLVHLLAPILTLIGFALFALFTSGIYLLSKKGEPLNLINILGTAPSIEILIVATVLALMVSILLLRRDKVIPVATIGKRFVKGLREMVGVSLVIILARGLSLVSGDLGTGTYLTQSVSSLISPQLIPLLIFAVSMLITVATGFSWSSMAIVMPIAFQMVHSVNMPDMLPVVSAAVISGAVSGEHIIPFSEKAVMSAAACKISPVFHIKTQIFQSISVFLAAAGGYLIFGLNGSLTLSFFIPLLILLGLHLLLARKNELARFE
jgi:Na+/H+ antiporter NhaC